MINRAIIGSGFGLSLPNCHIVAFCGKQTPRLFNILQDLSLKDTIHLYQGYQEMLNCDPLDAIAIGMPLIAQYQIAKMALEKNVHIFAEKPLTTELKHAHDLVDVVICKIDACFQRQQMKPSFIKELRIQELIEQARKNCKVEFL